MNPSVTVNAHLVRGQPFLRSKAFRPKGSYLKYFGELWPRTVPGSALRVVKSWLEKYQPPPTRLTSTANDGGRTGDVWVYKVTERRVHSGLTIPIGNVSSMLSWLGLWGSSRPPTITCDEGLPSLPDDIIHEIFDLLDTEALKSLSLTCKALSRPAKLFIHRTLYLTSWSGDSILFNIPSRWNIFKELPALGKRGLLQHTRHLSVFLPHDPLFVHDLQPHVRHLHALTNLRSLKTRWLDIPSFIPKMEEYFGAFLGTLQSLELECPRGDHKRILYFVCRFPSLRDLKISGVLGYSESMCDGGRCFDIKTSPPLDGTLDLRMDMEMGTASGCIDGHLILSDLVALPSGLKFRTLKFSRCTGNNLQLLVDACAPTLECMEFTGKLFRASFLHREERP